MNIIAKRLVLVGTKSGLVVMCKILKVVVSFSFTHARALILLSLLLLLLSILSKDTGSTKGKPVRGAPRLVTYMHTQMKIQHRNKTTLTNYN